MSKTIAFLGWDKPWASLFAGWLARAPDRLRRRLVVVPTRESGRKLRELLVAHAAQSGTGAVLGPRVATPEDFFRPDEAMPDAIRWAGWLAGLREADDSELAALFPAGLARKDEAWRLAVVRQIEQAREVLVSGNADFAAVAEALPEDASRWRELADLERRVVALWKQWGHADPVGQKRRRALAPECPQGVEEIVVAGVPDPTGLAVEAWRRLETMGISVTVLVGAPKDLEHTFDDWGRPKPEFWSDRNQHSTPEPDTSLVAADAVALAEAVVRECAGKSNQQVAVGVCDSSFLPAVARRFQEAGWLTFDPEGAPLAKDGWPEFLEALAAALDSADDLAAVIRVARHPVTWTQWLRKFEPNAAGVLAALDGWQVENSAVDAPAVIERMHDAGSKPAAGLLTKVHGFVKEAAAGTGEALESRLRECFEQAGEDVANRAPAEMDSWPFLQREGYGLPLRLRWLAASLASVSRNPDSADAVLALQGWLELPFDPAPHLILAGVHEGRVPEAPRAAPLISEAVCETLGLRNRKSRLAREVFLYTAMVEGRRAEGRVTVVTAQVDAQGEPCKPSRVLLQTKPEALPARVLKFVNEMPDVPLQPTPAWARGDWQLRVPAGASARKQWEHLSPSALKAYLTCPTRFYFARVLGWERFEPFDGELDARGFGNLIHGVLRAWGNDAQARELADAAKLRDCWRDLLREQANARFGDRVSPLVRLQLMSAEERLMEVAKKQVEQRLLGWHVIEVEKELNEVLKLAGLPIHLRIDRIDRHDDGRLRVIDYKTGKTAEPPQRTHLRVWSEDQCPDALGPLCRVTGTRGGEKLYGWTDLQLPLYVAAVKEEWKLDAWPEAYYALLPAAVADSEFVQFEKLDALMDSAMTWAGEAARRIVAGVFWPPAPEVAYDDLAAIAPEGLQQALGGPWAQFLSGNLRGEGGNAP